MSNPKISIIMGIYNCERTLDDAIQSILQQTYKNWEFVICDDGSTDNTYEIAEKYLKDFPDQFILLKNEKNRGLNYTLNRCLKVCTGEFIARMDGDDISLPYRLEKELKFLIEHPEYAVISTPMILFDENGVWGETSVIERPERDDFCTHSPFFCHAACMMKKTVFDEVNGYTENPRFLRVEDCNLWFKVYAHGYKGANLTEPLYKMRDDRNAIHRRNIKARLNSCYVLYDGFKQIKMPWYKYIYVIKNAIIEIGKCMIPMVLYEYIHKKNFERKNV